MATVFPVNTIINEALRAVGELSTHDAGSDPAKFAIAMTWLDMLVAEVVETERPLWLIPEAVTASIPIDTVPFDFVQAAASDIETDRFRGPITCAIVSDATGHADPLRRMTLQEYEAIGDKSAGGYPCAVYVDRTELRPLFYFDSVVKVTGYSLRVTFFLNNQAIAVNGEHGFPQAWQRFLVRALAADIGSGPVVRLPQSEIDDHRKQAEMARERLFARKNRPYARPNRVKFRD
jgi:hypothetical protein